MAKEIYLRRLSDPSISAVRIVLSPEKELRSAIEGGLSCREQAKARETRSRVQADDVRAARRIVQQPRPLTWASCCSGTSAVGCRRAPRREDTARYAASVFNGGQFKCAAHTQTYRFQPCPNGRARRARVREPTRASRIVGFRPASRPLQRRRPAAPWAMARRPSSACRSMRRSRQEPRPMMMRGAPMA